MQHNDVTMGASLASVTADSFMAHLETTLTDKLKSIGMCECHKYVNNTFVQVDPDAKLEGILPILNNFHPSINFAHENEVNDSLPIPDIRVTRSPEQRTFKTTIYWKPTFTGLMINWNSLVQM
jgi:hypothetical protein